MDAATKGLRGESAARGAADSEAGSGAPRRRRRHGPERGAGLLFVAPLLLLLVVFVYTPLVSAVRYSFTNWDGVSPPRWVGFANYSYLAQSSDFHQILRNNVILVAGIVVWVVVPMLLAVIIHERKRASLIRAVLFVPVLLPPVIVGHVFRLILADKGPLNASLRAMELDVLAPKWLTNPRVVLWSVILMILWATMGNGVMFFTAGIASISTNLVEAARIDGAGWFGVFWHVYRPGLRPTIRFWTLLLTIAAVTAFFPWIFGLTQGGPGLASTTLDYAVYASGIRDGQQGLASALAVLTILFVGLLLTTQLAVSRLRAAE